LANHGYLPRSGRDIDINAVRSAVSSGYNYAPATFDSAFKQAADFNLTTTGNASTFHLADLAKHDNVEFDGSLSRNDIFFRDNLHFDAKIWAATSERLKLNDLGPGNSERYVTVEVAAKAQAARVVDAKKANPSFNASANQMMGGPGTTALYLTTLWDDKAGAVPKSWIRAWFGMLNSPVSHELPSRGLHCRTNKLCRIRAHPIQRGLPIPGYTANGRNHWQDV
jgi:hypothetical protein